MSNTIPPRPAAHDIPYAQYQAARRQHWNSATDWMLQHKGLGKYYHQRLASVYRLNIAANLRVLEIGCSQGDLLASLNPSYGMGIDFSEKMIAQAQILHPDLQFLWMDAHELELRPDISFDIIILSDLLNDLWDIQVVLEQIHKVTNAHTRLLINTYSRLWELPLLAAEKLGLAKPALNQNWLTIGDIKNLLNLSGYETVRYWHEILFPIDIPLLTSLCNRFLVKLFPFDELALTNFIIARPRIPLSPLEEKPSVSIVIPARNESGNIPCIFENPPTLNCNTELIFVEGNSKDNTYQVIKQQIDQHPELQCSLFKQTGTGKGNAVLDGFQHACGDILMILDADLTVPVFYLERFYDAIASGKGDFINGVRLVYPLEKQSMKIFNFLGNKFFSVTFSWLLGQPVKDTLCGTKVLWKSDYEQIVRNRAYFGDFDPFGDFDLLLGAAKLGLKILDLPVRYRERTYGTSNIQRWKHGWLLLKMTVFAARRLKFV
ncbi:MAG TPA: glycosyltransferase [Anaerolineaceae bacterium]|nr:glycosyltransferase [Anaerolineaceae bacterium]